MKKLIITLSLVLGIIPSFAFADTLQNLNIDYRNVFENGAWVQEQSFTGFGGHIETVSFINDSDLDINPNAWEADTGGFTFNLTIYDYTSSTTYIAGDSNPDVNRETGEVKFTPVYTNPSYVFIPTHEYWFYLTTGSNSRRQFFRGTIGNTFYEGENTSAIGFSSLNCTEIVSGVYQCDNIGQLADLYFDTNTIGGLTNLDIIDAYYYGTSTANIASLSEQNCSYLDIACAVSKGIANIVGVLFKPNIQSTTFLSDAWSKGKNTFPFSLFFTIQTLVKTEAMTATSTQSLNLGYSFPSGNLSYSTGTVAILTPTTLADRFGTTVVEWWYNILLSAVMILLLLGMWKTIFKHS